MLVLLIWNARGGGEELTLLWLRWLSVIVERAHLIPLCVADARVTGRSDEGVGSKSRE